MKAGDLVMLSSYGNRRDYNINLKTISGTFRLGLVTKVANWASYPYEVAWLQCDSIRPRDQKPCKGNHMRRELKYAYHHKSKKSF